MFCIFVVFYVMIEFGSVCCSALFLSRCARMREGYGTCFFGFSEGGGYSSCGPLRVRRHVGLRVRYAGVRRGEVVVIFW